MRAWKKQPSDEVRERCLGEIARLLDAAREVESIPPVDQKKVRRRIMRTLFRTRVSLFRTRLAPVLSGLGILVIGGAAFATAERFGLIPGLDLSAAGAPAGYAKAEARKRKAVRGRRPADPAPAKVDEPSEPRIEEENAVAVEETVILPEVPDPLLIATSEASSSVWAPLVESTTDFRPGSVALAPTRKMSGISGKAIRRAIRQVAFVSPTPVAPVTIAEDPAAVAVSASAIPVVATAIYTPIVRGDGPTEVAPGSAPVSSVHPSSMGIARARPTGVQPVALIVPIPPPKVSTDAVAEIGRSTASDQALFGQAMRKLRLESNPMGALAALQEHAKAYPRTAFVGERSALEVEALLALHREHDALARLDGMSLDDLPRSGERFVVRGELRAAARRWLEASADFDRALSRVSGSPTWHERALWGRGVARLRCGEREAGLGDLERYLDRYPKGRFAAEAAKFFRNK
jgi:hypothetical protein